MKKKILIGAGITIILIVGVLTYLRSATKKHSPEASAAYKEKGYDIEIRYCRPFKKGRVIFGPVGTGALQPYQTYWRAGANEATTFQTKTPLHINGKELAAGTYALYAIPNSGEWTIAFNSDYNRWGATAPDTKDDVLRVNVPANDQANMQEQFLISFNPSDSLVNMMLHWDNTMVSVPLELKK